MKPNATLPPAKPKRRDPLQEISDIGITFSLSKASVLTLQEEVEKNPGRYLETPLKEPEKGFPILTLPSTHESPFLRQETAKGTFQKIAEQVEIISEGNITRDDIHQAVEQRCLARTLSILYSAVTQWNTAPSKLEIFDKAGEPVERQDKKMGTRGGGLCYAFLKQNGLIQKINFREMAIELKAAFEETFQSIRGQLETDGFEIDESMLRKILASELTKKTGGRIPRAYNIQNAKAAAQAFCTRLQFQKAERLRHLAADIAMAKAVEDFVENQLPPSFLQFLLKNPLQPLYELRESGQLVMDPTSGEPVFNPNIPEKWHQKESLTPIEAKYREFKAKNPSAAELVGSLMDNLRLPRLLNIPLQVAIEALEKTFEPSPEILRKATLAQKDVLSYEISKPAHQMAFKLAFILKAANENLLDPKEKEIATQLDRALKELPEKPLLPTSYANRLFGNDETPGENLATIQSLFIKSKDELALVITKEEPYLPPIAEPSLIS